MKSTNVRKNTRETIFIPTELIRERSKLVIDDKPSISVVLASFPLTYCRNYMGQTNFRQELCELNRCMVGNKRSTQLCNSKLPAQRSILSATYTQFIWNS